MNVESLAAAAVLTLAAGSALAASPTNPVSFQPVEAQPSTNMQQVDPIDEPVYRPNVAAYPYETPYVIGGKTFYYDGNASIEVGGDGANN